MQDLYKRIDALRAKMGKTVTAMCRESGANRASLTDLKVGRKKSLSADTLSKLSNYFSVSVDFLCGKEDGLGLTADDWQTLGTLYKAEREMAGVSVDKIAVHSGMKKCAISAFEDAGAPLDPEELTVMCGLLNGKTLKDVFHGYADNLMGERRRGDFSAPTPTDDTVSFPVIGGVAAGYDHIAYEDWTGDTIDIPRSYLRGRPPQDYFVLKVKGDSMYPDYHDGDHVVVLRQETMDRSGQVGVVIYGDENATLKRIEYVNGEDWMTLRPINPQFPPVTIRDEHLEHCKVLGVAKYVIRTLD